VIAILGVNVAIGFPFNAYSGLLEAELRFDIQASLRILGTVLRTGLIVWAVARGGGLIAMAWMTFAVSLAVIALQTWFARRQAPWARLDRLPIDFQKIKRFFSYSIYTFVSVIGDVFRFQLDAVVIAGLIGLAAVTHYRIASAFSTYYIGIVTSVIGLIQPVLSRLYGAQDRRGLEKVLFFSIRVSMSISVFVGFGLISWGRQFIARWMGPQYKDAYWPLVVLSIAIFLDVSQCPSISLLYATFNHRFYTYLNGAEGLINLAVSLALARPLGVLGVALGTLIAALVVRVVALPLWVCRVSGLDYEEYMRFLGGTFLRCVGLMGGAVAVSAWGFKPSYPWLLGSVLLATLVYGGLSYLFIFTGTDREKLLLAARLPTRHAPAIATSMELTMLPASIMGASSGGKSGL
jgi:O-antigen/teichoic acid export membrane protein